MTIEEGRTITGGEYDFVYQKWFENGVKHGRCAAVPKGEEVDWTGIKGGPL